MSKQKGFAPVLIIFAFAAIGILLISANRFTNPSHKVAGIEIAKGDDSSSGGSDSGSSGGGSGSSGSSSSGGSGSSSTSGSSGEVKSSPTPSATTRQVQVETHKSEPETETENEAETADVEEFDVEVKDGQFELNAKEATEASKLAKLKNANAISVKLNEKNVELQAENDHINLKLGNIEAETHFPLTINQATGQLLVITPNGLRLIRVLPDSASQIAQNAGIQNKIDKVEILSSSSSSDSVVIKLTGAKTGSILGIIPVNQPVETEVGAQTGQIVNTNEPFWLKLLSPLIRT